LKKKKLFYFTKINIFPFLSPIIIYIRDYLISLAKYKNDGLGATFQYEFMDGLMHSLCGILYLISYLRSITKKTKNEAVNNKIKNNLIKDNKDNKYNNSNKRKIFFLILIITVSYTVYISNSKILSKKYNIFEIRIYNLLFNAIFCKIILKDSIFRHQLLSLALAAIG